MYKLELSETRLEFSENLNSLIFNEKLNLILNLWDHPSLFSVRRSCFIV